MELLAGGDGGDHHDAAEEDDAAEDEEERDLAEVEPRGHCNQHVTHLTSTTTELLKTIIYAQKSLQEPLNGFHLVPLPQFPQQMPH